MIRFHDNFAPCHKPYACADRNAEVKRQLVKHDSAAREFVGKNARTEAVHRQPVIDFRVVDMRRVWDVYERRFDVMIAYDDTMPHMLTDMDDRRSRGMIASSSRCWWRRN